MIFLLGPKVGIYIQVSHETEIEEFGSQIFNPHLHSQWYTLFYTQNNYMNVAYKAFLFLLYGLLLKYQLNGNQLPIFLN